MAKQEPSTTLFEILLRQPPAILGAIGFISLLKGVITIQEDLLVIIEAYQSVTRPIWDFLLGWLFLLLKWEFPILLKDYLTMGLVVGGAFVRAEHALDEPSTYYTKFKNFILTIALWPITFIGVVTVTVANQYQDKKWEDESSRFIIIFCDFIVWTFILIAFSYSMLLF